MPTTGHTAQTEQRILNDSKDSLYDTIATTPYLETTVGAVAQRATATDVGGKIAQDVNIVGGSLTGSDGAILDGANSTIKATVEDYTNSNPLAVTLKDTNGDYISVGGGTQYTEDAAAAANPVGTVLNLIREDARAGGLTTTDGDNVAARGNNKGELYVKTTDSDALLTTIDADTGNISTKIDTVAGAVAGTEMQVDVVTSALPSGAATSAKQDTGNTSLATLAGAVAGTEMQVDVLTMPTVTETSASAIKTAVELIDDTVFTDDTSTHATGTTKGVGIMAVATPTDASVNANDIGMPAMTTDRKLHVSVQDALPAGTNAIGKLAANSGVDIGDVDVTSIAAGDNNIGNVDIVTVPTDPFGANADAASATGSISAKLKGIATALGVTALDLGSGTGGTRTLRTFQDTAQFVGGTGTSTSATQRVTLATDIALPAGTNAIGKLAANSGVDIGDVDVTSIAAGTNSIGNVGSIPRTSGGLLIKNCTSGDGSTALTNSAQAIKASAGQLFGWYIYNPNTVACWVIIYNTAAASVTVGTTNPVMVLGVPAGSAANVLNPMGIEFTNAGWSAAAVMTSAGGNTAPTTALDANFFYI